MTGSVVLEASAPEKITHPSATDLKEKEKSEPPVQLKEAVSIEPEKETEEEEEEETCEFCKFMKAGGCKSQFVSWMECVDSEKAKGNDFVETCMTQIQDLRECMLANPAYYRPMLEEEGQYLDEKEAELERTNKKTTEAEEAAKQQT